MKISNLQSQELQSPYVFDYIGWGLCSGTANRGYCKAGVKDIHQNDTNIN